jgi:hypothetical protein
MQYTPYKNFTLHNNISEYSKRKGGNDDGDEWEKYLS